jgi:hypothetical protein
MSAPLFLTLVVVLDDATPDIAEWLARASATLDGLAEEHELLVVDRRGAIEESTLANLTGPSGVPNLLVLRLLKSVEFDAAACCGLEHALGDFVAVLDPSADELDRLPAMLDRARQGHDVVFARNLRALAADGMVERAFQWAFRVATGIDARRDAPRFRVLSRRVVNHLLQHRSPVVAYRLLPGGGGYRRCTLDYEAPVPRSRAPLLERIDRGMRLLASGTRAPMRLVTLFSLFGAVANVLYSIYVVAVALLKADVEPGWVSLSLQQSGMFFLISLTLLVLGEYVLQMASLSNEGPPYHVASEHLSTKLTRRERLNVATPASGQHGPT